MAELRDAGKTEGEYMIVAFELQGDEDWDEEGADEVQGGDAPASQTSDEADTAEAFENLVVYPVDWDYRTEAEAWTALDQLVADRELPPGEYGVIKLCTTREIVSVEDKDEESATKQ